MSAKSESCSTIRIKIASKLSCAQCYTGEAKLCQCSLLNLIASATGGLMGFCQRKRTELHCSGRQVEVSANEVCLVGGLRKATTLQIFWRLNVRTFPTRFGWPFGGSQLSWRAASVQVGVGPGVPGFTAHCHNPHAMSHAIAFCFNVLTCVNQLVVHEPMNPYINSKNPMLTHSFVRPITGVI